MSGPLYFEDLQIGDAWHSPARTVTEADVVNFAGMTGDYDPLHVDHEHARQTHYRRPIAHGLLGLSWVAGLASQSPRVATVAFVAVRNWEFRRPMFTGDTLHVVNTIVEKRASGRRSGHILWRRDLVNQDGVTVQMGYFETLVAVRFPDARKRTSGAAHAVPTAASTTPPDELAG